MPSTKAPIQLWAGTQIKWRLAHPSKTREIAHNKRKISFIRRAARMISIWNNASRRWRGTHLSPWRKVRQARTTKWILTSPNSCRWTIQKAPNMIDSSRKDSQIADSAQISKIRITSFRRKAWAAITPLTRWAARTFPLLPAGIMSSMEKLANKPHQILTRTIKFSRPYSVHNSLERQILTF